jgi:hypothetical protein
VNEQFSREKKTTLLSTPSLVSGKISSPWHDSNSIVFFSHIPHDFPSDYQLITFAWLFNVQNLDLSTGINFD